MCRKDGLYNREYWDIEKNKFVHHTIHRNKLIILESYLQNEKFNILIQRKVSELTLSYGRCLKQYRKKDKKLAALK